MHFLIKSGLKAPPTEEVMALFPAEQAKGQELAEQGIQEAVYLAADQSCAWLIWNCESRDALEEIHKTLPLHDYLNAEITMLSDAF